MTERYRIGEIAELTDVSVEALRYYEQRGLLRTPPRTDGGLRRYGPDAVEQVNFIKQAQALGLTLQDIQHLIVDGRQRKGADCRRVRELLARHIATIDRRLQDLKQLRQTLSDHLAACDATLQKPGQPACPTLNALQAPRSTRKVTVRRS